LRIRRNIAPVAALKLSTLPITGFILAGVAFSRQAGILESRPLR
jgi:hypothetical protein